MPKDKMFWHIKSYKHFTPGQNYMHAKKKNTIVICRGTTLTQKLTHTAKLARTGTVFALQRVNNFEGQSVLTH